MEKIFLFLLLATLAPLAPLALSFPSQGHGLSPSHRPATFLIRQPSVHYIHQALSSLPSLPSLHQACDSYKLSSRSSSPPTPCGSFGLRATPQNTENEDADELQTRKRRRRRKDASIVTMQDDNGATATESLGSIEMAEIGEAAATLATPESIAAIAATLEGMDGMEGMEESNAETANDGGGGEEATNGGEAKICPLFSMTFPRYRIDFSSDARTAGDGDSDKSKMNSKQESEQRRIRRVHRGIITKLSRSPNNGNVPKSPMSSMSSEKKAGPWEFMANVANILNGNENNSWRNSQKGQPGKKIDEKLVSSLQKMYKDEVERGTFRMAPLAPISSESSQYFQYSEYSLLADEDFVAASSFWRMASDIHTNITHNIAQFYNPRQLPQLQQVLQPSDASLQSLQEGRWYLALPETTPTVARHLCDILNWYGEFSMERFAASVTNATHASNEANAKKANNANGGKVPAGEGRGSGESRESRESGDNVGGSPVLLHAQLDHRSSHVPVVEFTIQSIDSIGSISSLQPSQSSQPPRPSQSSQPLSLSQPKSTWPTAAQTELQTKAWVKRLLVQLGICPFTKSELKSGQGLGDMGVPVANIMYAHSDAHSDAGRWDVGGVYSLMADAWEAISHMIAAGPSGKNGISSILLSAPGFDDDFPLWAGPVFAMLEAGVEAVEGSEMIGVVCFHPNYVTPDGKSWPGFGQMHSLPRLKKWYYEHATSITSTSSSTSAAPSPPKEIVAPTELTDNEIAAGGAWQRRTPHAVINVLRAEQLEAAEGRRKTGELYARNIEVLVGKRDGVGIETLASDLEKEQCL